MADELSNNRAKVRFMAQFNSIYTRDWLAEQLISLESQINPEGFQVFADLIREGIVDGSLRSDRDPGLTMHTVINAGTGASAVLPRWETTSSRNMASPSIIRSAKPSA